MTIVNLTQHQASPEQIQAGVVDLAPEARSKLQKLLTFDKLEDTENKEVVRRALEIAELAAATGASQAMIGGAFWLVIPLENALSCKRIATVFAFSQRVSEDQVQPDGSVKKVAVFRHVGFVRPNGT